MRKDQLVKALLASPATSVKSSASKVAAQSGAAAKAGVGKTLPVGKKLAAPVRRAPSAKAPIARQRRVTTSGSAGSNGSARKSAATPDRPQRTTPRRVAEPLRRAKERFELAQHLSNGSEAVPSAEPRADRIVIMVRDCYWLHAYWEVKRQSVERAKAAMGQDWHLARPTLRVLEVSDGGMTSASERIVQEIEIHGGVSNWYIHVSDPPKSYRVEIGYRGRTGKFYSIARSNVVTTPRPGSSDALDENWADVARNFEKIYAMSGGYSAEIARTELQELFEERLRRPMGSSLGAGFASGAGIEGLLAMPRDLELSVDAEMILFGSTRADARVTMRGEPVKLRPDGTFTVRMSLPNQRQVIPVVAYAAGGAEQRTVVLAVERNTKIMEPVVCESNAE